MSSNSNPCLITGCDLQLLEGGVYAHGDLFEFGDCYVFNAVTKSHGEPAWQKAAQSANILRMSALAHYFERRGVFVIPKAEIVLSEAAQAYIAKWR